jgi:hypothetical protein
LLASSVLIRVLTLARHKLLRMPLLSWSLQPRPWSELLLQQPI